MTLEDLRIFVAAGESASLSALARQLGRTQASVSQHVARLEREFAVPLIARSARGIELTEAGYILWELALQGLDAIELARERIRALQQGETGTLTVTTGGTTVRHFLRRAIVRFRDGNPGVNLRFLPAGSSRRCFELLRLGRADLALATTGERAPGVATRTLAFQRFFLLVAMGDPFAQRERVCLDDLRDIHYLGLAEGIAHRALLEEAAAAQGVHLEPELAFDDFDTASIFVELGMGQAIVPAVQAHNFTRTAEVCAVPIEGLPEVPFGWGFRHQRHIPATAKRFVEVFEGELESLARIRGVRIVTDGSAVG
ncbi:LysR family transcriptional regulator [Sediminicurvatus halobius]|uniref:LysR family transcriptional regulator n=1 Tax=Sediminicurvatus halobius TaxID=2182432 RepID=A0A2U2MX54_9GAMM|nr:LysR family transcriptional regulator [Spiribacter halobius]PWG61376.1 LysR family transcriptional regulator [Spiribacter halobius]UEX76589.1 LysR family transcriptional regulator [Spiribacter halobius]